MEGSILDFEGSDGYFDFVADIPPLFGDASFNLDFDFGFSDIPDPNAFSHLPGVEAGYDVGFGVMPSIHSGVVAEDNFLALGTFDDLNETTKSLQSIEKSQPHLDEALVLLASVDSQLRKDKSGSHDSHEKVSTRKRPWDDSLVVFTTDGGNHVPQRQRKAYSETRKKEVARNRLIGACAQCKLRRGPCNFGIPCDHCIKRAGSAALAQEICYRRSLVNTRFDKIDMFEISVQRKRLQGYMATCSETSSRDIYIGYAPLYSEDVSQTFIRVPVLEFQNTGDITMSYLTATYHGCGYIAYQGPPLLIASDRLPNTEWLMKAYKKSRFSQIRGVGAGQGPFVQLDNAITRFANRYCASKKPLPKQKLIQKCVDMKLLMEMYGAVLTTRDSPFSKSCYTTLPIHRQLTLIICKDIVTLELDILSEIDKLVSGSSGIGKDNPLVIWVILWILMLTYHHRMILVGYNRSNSATEIHGLTKHLYNSITSIYNGLFKTTCPLTLDWRTEEISHLFGQDQELISLFCGLKTEIFWFRMAANDLRPEDELFMKLVVENDNRLLKAHRKAARRRGVI